MLANTSAGREALIKLLDDKDPSRAAFAIEHMADLNDLDNIPLIIAAADKYADNPVVLDSTIDAITELLGVPRAIGRYGADDAVNLTSIKNWLNDNKLLWKGKSYIVYWKERAEVVINDVDKSNWEKSEYLEDALCHLEMSDNGDAIVPIYIKWINSVKPERDNGDVIRRLIGGIQVYIGPLNVPNKNDTKGILATVRELNDWWKENSQKTQQMWIYGRLKERGVIRSDLRDLRGICKECLRVLINGHDDDIYSILLLLHHMMPSSFSVYIDRNMIEGKISESSFRDYILTINKYNICRVIYFDYGRYRWDEKAVKYTRGNQGTGTQY